MEHLSADPLDSKVYTDNLSLLVHSSNQHMYAHAMPYLHVCMNTELYYLCVRVRTKVTHLHCLGINATRM